MRHQLLFKFDVRHYRYPFVTPFSVIAYFIEIFKCLIKCEFKKSNLKYLDDEKIEGR